STHAVFCSRSARQAKPVPFWLRIGREPNRIGLIEWPYFFRANIAATEPLPHNAFQEFGASEVIKDHNRKLSRSHRIAGGNPHEYDDLDPPERYSPVLCLCSLQCSLPLNSETVLTACSPSRRSGRTGLHHSRHAS